MVKKKGVTELGIGTIVILTLALSMLLLGLILVKTMFNKPTIYKEECRNESDFRFIYSKERLENRNLTIEDLYYITYITKGHYEYDIKCRKDISDCWVYRIEEICEQAPVDEIILEPKLIYSSEGDYYMDERISKKDIDKNWLEENCEVCCYNVCAEKNKEIEKIDFEGCEAKSYKCEFDENKYFVEIK